MNDSILSLQRLALELIAARRPVDEILDQLCLLVQEIVPQGLATVMRFDAGRNSLTFRNAPSAAPEVLGAFGALTPGPFSGSCGSAVYERKLVAVEDTLSDPRWRSLRGVAEEFGIAACWSVPIFLDENEIAGTFAISRTVAGAPEKEQRELLEIAAYLAGVVLRLEREDQRLREQHRLLRSIVDCAEDPIFVKDLDGRYRLVNEAKARYLGLKVADVIGKTDAELHAPADQTNVNKSDRVVLEEHTPVVQEAEIRSPTDGRRHEFLVRKDPLRDADGKVIGLVGISRDITERRRVERAMQQAQKLESLGVLAGGIAHDFNNLLVGVLANASMLEDEQDISTEDLHQALREIRKASARAAELTNQLLQYAGKRKPTRTEIRIADLLREAPELLAGSIPKNVRVQVDAPSDLPTIAGDVVQVRQVVMNLLMNAAEACGENDGHVRVDARLLTDRKPTGRLLHGHCDEQRDWIRIDVQDDGCGMTQETTARIFDPFFTTKSKGRGLGLAAVLGIVGAHDGCLEVESDERAGTTFRVWLPASSTPAEEPAARAPSQAPRSGRVLVVEDEEMVGKVLCRILTRHGYEAQLATRGDEGLALFEQEPRAFALVILDYTMPGLNGAELAGRIRRADTQVPILMTSGLTESDVRPVASRGHVDGFLCKPFTADDVLVAIDDALQARATIDG